MKHGFLGIWLIAGLLTAASAVVWAQNVPDMPADPSAPLISAPQTPPDATAPITAPPDAPMEEATDPNRPIDTPVDTPSDGNQMVPDINLDEAGFDALDQSPSANVSRAPRKALSDAGDNGGVERGQNLGTVAAQEALIARSKRRERPIDPVKRAELTRLSRVMGALHALRVSCAGRDDQTYRSRMATMLDLEAPQSGALRDPLVDAFNGGFQSHGRGANACPSDARAQEARLAKDGYSLAQTLSARYRPAPTPASNLPAPNQPRVNVPVEKSAAIQPTPVVTKTATRPSWNTKNAD